MKAKDLSVLIPARNEKFLVNTINDILSNAEADTEIIVVLDGYWPDPPIEDKKNVIFIHFTEPIGQRAGVNVAASISRAKYVMKLDAHCAVAKGFDRQLISDGDSLGFDVTQIPKMHNLHVFDWVCKSCGARYYQADPVDICPCGCKEFGEDVVWKMRKDRTTEFWRFDHTMHFQYWRRYEKRQEAKPDIADTMSSIGASFFMQRERFMDLGGLDEKHGSWGQFGTEIACKSWLSGGRQVTNKKTWFAHLFRVGKLRFPYQISGDEQERAREYSRDLWMNNKWPNQVRPLSWLVEKFAPVKGWHDPEGAEALARVTEAGKSFHVK
jgi:glycosyltransferase involved in cell wall biosynthesis